MSFSANQYGINQLFGNNLLDIPRNQRRYVWSETNWNDLLTDIEFIVDKSTSPKHFIGSIVLRKEDSVNGLDKYSIIDGQQRTITIILLLLALIRIFKENNLKSDVEGTQQFLYVMDRKGNKYLVLHNDAYIDIEDLANEILKAENKCSLDQIFNNCLLSVKSKRLKAAFLYFYNHLKQKETSEGVDKLIQFRDSLLDTNYIRIDTDTEEDAYTVFEILNARGQSLEPYELLKNYIMRYIHPKEMVDDVKQKWGIIEDVLGSNINNFFRHYVVHKIDTPDKKDIYRVIQNAFPKDRVESLLKDIYAKAHLYSHIINPSSERDECEYKIFSYLKSKRSVQLRPLLLSLLTAYEYNKAITKEEYIKSLTFLKNFFVCFSIISSEKSNKLTEIINKYSISIGKMTEADKELLASFYDAMKSKLPSQETFINKFKELGYSNHTDFYNDSNKKNQVVAALELIESHLSPDRLVEGGTIEHILPDSADKVNAKIGNLTLLEKGLNSKCKDLPLQDKLEKYGDSNFRMTRRLKERYGNNPESFKADIRAAEMAKMIYKDILKFNGK
ncbi:MAG: DUF262 domain-containing protein [Bacteroidales bacterium]|nr:DUF262 domain-containing protein [Bacteroidales bacterium]